MKKTCLNCNQEGHKFKNCKLSIQSFGVIAYQKKPFEDINFLLIQRRNTIAYTDFLRGKYKRENVHLYFQQMTQEERTGMVGKDFKSLWDELWFDHNSNIYKNELRKAREIFQTVDIDILLNTTFSPYTSTEWGLPKGRRNLNESPIECAIREFSEETEIKPNNYTVHYDLQPLVEEFTAIDGNKYKHIYYFAKLNNSVQIDTVKKTKVYFQEVKDIGVFSVDKCMELIRDYNIEKRNVINIAYSILKDIKTRSIKWN